jgi:hypothetical protein
MIASPFIYEAAGDTYKTLFHLMTLANNHSDVSIFRNRYHVSSASTVYGSMGVQIVSQNIRHSANNSTAMSASWKEQHLKVQLLNVWIIGAAMVVLKCLTLLIIILCPINVAPEIQIHWRGWQPYLPIAEA